MISQTRVVTARARYGLVVLAHACHGRTATEPLAQSVRKMWLCAGAFPSGSQRVCARTIRQRTLVPKSLLLGAFWLY
jgi:hypothetical protein